MEVVQEEREEQEMEYIQYDDRVAAVAHRHYRTAYSVPRFKTASES